MEGSDYNGKFAMPKISYFNEFNISLKIWFLGLKRNTKLIYDLRIPNLQGVVDEGDLLVDLFKIPTRFSRPCRKFNLNKKICTH